MTSQHKLVAGTVAVALLAGGGAALAAFELSTSSSTAATPAAAVTTTFAGNGVGGAYDFGAGRLGGRGLGGGLGPGDDRGFDGGSGPGLGGPRFLASGFAAAATYLDLTPAALRAQLAGGQTLAQVAKAKGKTVDGLVAAMAGAQKKALEAAVANGFLTQAQADRIAANLQAMMKQVVNGLRQRPGLDDGFGDGSPGSGGSGSGSF